MSKIILTTNEELKEMIKSALREYNLEVNSNTPDKLYTINKIAKRLGRSHDTINKLVKRGVIKTTKDGLIPESAINEYLGQ